MITVAKLIACGVGPTQAKLFNDPLVAACSRFDISSDFQIAGFLTQSMHESLSFTRLEESLFYSRPERIQMVWPKFTREEAQRLVGKPEALANAAYGNRADLGNDQAGDGWKYRGRGLFQLTGKANYRHYGAQLDLPLVEKPELLTTPENAALSAAVFWVERGCNALMVSGDFDATSAKINPHEAAELRKVRRARFATFYEQLRKP